MKAVATTPTQPHRTWPIYQSQLVILVYAQSKICKKNSAPSAAKFLCCNRERKQVNWEKVGKHAKR